MEPNLEIKKRISNVNLRALAKHSCVTTTLHSSIDLILIHVYSLLSLMLEFEIEMNDFHENILCVHFPINELNVVLLAISILYTDNDRQTLIAITIQNAMNSTFSSVFQLFNVGNRTTTNACDVWCVRYGNLISNFLSQPTRPCQNNTIFAENRSSSLSLNFQWNVTRLNLVWINYLVTSK
jgi:hypothetical protein